MIRQEDKDINEYLTKKIDEQNGNSFLDSVSTPFSLTDNQIETIADLFSKREHIAVSEMDAEWLLSHAFQLGMKTYRDLLNGC